MNNNYNWKELPGIVHLLSCVYLVPTLLFSIGTQRPALWLFFGTYIVDYVINKRWQHWHWNNEKIMFVIWCAYFLLIPIYHCFEATQSPIYSHTLNYDMPFLGIGIMGLLGFSRQIKLRYIAWAFVTTSIATIAYIFYYVYLSYDSVNSVEQLSYFFAEQRIAHIGPHMHYNLFLNAALILSYYLCSCKTSNRWQKVVAGCGAAIILGTLLISDGRVGFATSVITTLIFAISLVWKRWRKFVIPFIAILGVCGIVMLISHPRIKNSNASHEPRVYIWNVAHKVIAERPILGFGVADGRNRFIEVGENDADFVTHYATDFHTRSPYPYAMHPHNMLLEGWIEFGILGLTLILAIFIFPFFIKNTDNRLYLIQFAIAVLMQAMFETFGSDLMPLLITLVILWLIVGNNEKFELRKLQ